VSFGFPPQLGLLVSILLIALPVMLLHLRRASEKEKKKGFLKLNRLTQRLPLKKLILYSIALVLIAFVIWGITQPINNILSSKLFRWLPSWFTEQDFTGYPKKKIELTLFLNLVLNGILAPLIEEFYFRAYLLSRMFSFGKSAVFINTILFSLYHFWQPYIYLTLVLSLLPMVYLVWKTKDIRLAIFTHSLLNITGAILTFGLLTK
jgi:membrane protease YdiL (CAAX protease family)